MAVKNRIGKQFAYTKIEGFAELKKVLDGLPRVVQKKALGPACAGGAALIKDAVKDKLRANGSIISGRLLRSIDVVDNTNYSGVAPDIDLEITARRDAGFQGNHAHLVEFGHKFVLVNPKTKQIVVTRRKRVKAYPFMRPAYDETAQKSIDFTIQRLRGLAMPILRRAMPGARIS